MASFKKNTSINGTFKNVGIVGDALVDAGTNEEIDLIAILRSVYGESTPFDIKTSTKVDEDIDVE